MSKNLPVHRAVNGRYYVRLPNGQTRFISDEEAEQLVAEADEILPPAKRTTSTRRTRVPAAHVAVRGRFELDFNERQLGWVLRGFVETARNRRDDVSRLFGTDERAASERREHSQALSRARRRRHRGYRERWLPGAWHDLKFRLASRWVGTAAPEVGTLTACATAMRRLADDATTIYARGL